MPSRLPHDLLERSARESARLLALTYLSQIDRAQSRVGDSQDAEALHDFRVGLRRLRSALSAYREQLDDSVTKKMRNRMRDLARATNGGRDAEVQLAWLERQAGRLGADDPPGYFWLLGRLGGRKQEVHDPATAEAARRYAKVAGKVRRALGVLRIELGNGRDHRPATFGRVTGGLISHQLAQTREELGRIRDGKDFEQVHRARIALKRLRYLIEPVARRNRRARALVQRFKEVQDLLGEHHDLHALAEEIESLRADLPESGHLGLETGLATLARRAEDEAGLAYHRFQALQGGELSGRILTRADELRRLLEQPAPPVGAVPLPELSDPRRLEETAAGPEREYSQP